VHLELRKVRAVLEYLWDHAVLGLLWVQEGLQVLLDLGYLLLPEALWVRRALRRRAYREYQEIPPVRDYLDYLDYQDLQ